MSCILRRSGEVLDIDALLSQRGLAHYRVWKKGEPHTRKGKIHSGSGANFIASEADLDEFNRQVKEATEFPALHASAIAGMVSFPGVQNAVLDFGVALSEGYVAQLSYLPPDFIRLAASVGIAVEISHYACREDDDES